MNSEYYYNLSLNQKSDINELMPIIFDYAKKCEKITEFGIRSGNSTKALLHAKPKSYIGYDIEQNEEHQILKKIAEIENIKFNIFYESSLKISIEETDLLMIDSYHCFSQLIQELFLHGRKVSKYIILHDTEVYGFFDEGHCIHCKKPLYLNNNAFPTFGLMPAIQLFIKETQIFKIKEQFKNNHGLTILEKI